MLWSWLRVRLPVLAVLLSACWVPVHAGEFLDVNAAFRMSAAPQADGSLGLRFDIAPGYHLYRERISVKPEPAALHLQPLTMPRGILQHDDNFGRDMEIYRDRLALHVAFDRDTPAGAAALRVSYQGCAEAGLCYPPQTRTVHLRLGPGGRVEQVTPTGGAAPAASDDNLATPAAALPVLAAAPPAAPASDASRIQSALQSGHLLTIAFVFLVAGLLLSSTPCVLPMVPILSSIIVGQGVHVGRGRGFALPSA